MENPNRPAQLLEKKGVFLKEFLRLTVQQKQALTENDMDRFNALLDAKQLVIEQVDLLDAELALLKQKEPRPGTVAKNVIPSGATTGRPDKITGLEQAIRLYLREIKELDIEINELLKKNMDETIQSINELQAARRTQNAYRNQARAANSYFINKKR